VLHILWNIERTLSETNALAIYSVDSGVDLSIGCLPATRARAGSGAEVVPHRKGTNMSKTSSAKKTARTTPKTSTRKAAGTSKLDTLVELLRRPTGASIQDLAAATGWQTHSVRGALAGTLKKKGHSINSEMVEGVRRYRIAEAQA
jgi:hypothetical protein